MKTLAFGIAVLILAGVCKAQTEQTPDPTKWMCRELAESGNFTYEGETVFGKQACRPIPQVPMQPAGAAKPKIGDEATATIKPPAPAGLQVGRHLIGETVSDFETLNKVKVAGTTATATGGGCETVFTFADNKLKQVNVKCAMAAVPSLYNTLIQIYGIPAEHHDTLLHGSIYTWKLQNGSVKYTEGTDFKTHIQLSLVEFK